MSCGAMPREFRSRTLRSLMRSGGSIVVSLPKSWLDAVKLDEGDYVVVEVAGSSLIISPTEVEEEREVKLRFESDLRALIDKIVAAYLMGWDSIRVAFPRNLKETLEREIFYLKERLMDRRIRAGFDHA